MNLDIVTSSSNSIAVSGKSIVLIEGKDQKVIDHLSSNDRPLLLSELDMRMENRRWGYPFIKCVQETSEGSVYGGHIPTKLNFGDNNMFFPLPIIDKSDYSVCSDITSSTTFASIETLYKNMLIMKESDGVTFYSSSKIIVDFLNSSIALDLINEDEYTNTISLINVEKKLNLPDISCKVDLTIKYVKDGIYCRDLTFKAFKLLNEGLVRDDFVSSLDGDVIVEYVDGIVRVVPEVPEISECIISNCILTYGCI